MTSPNPAVGTLTALYTVTNDDAARIEMFNVRGQRILARAIGNVGAGAHRVEIGNAKDYPSGVYFLRLTQAGRSVTSRFVVVR